MTNPLCPDHTSHYENAADRLFPHHGHVLSVEEQELVDAEAEAEYRHCEGH